MYDVKRTSDFIDRILIQLALKVCKDLMSSMTSLVRVLPHINRKMSMTNLSYRVHTTEHPYQPS